MQKADFDAWLASAFDLTASSDAGRTRHSMARLSRWRCRMRLRLPSVSSRYHPESETGIRLCAGCDEGDIGPIGAEARRSRGPIRSMRLAYGLVVRVPGAGRYRGLGGGCFGTRRMFVRTALVAEFPGTRENTGKMTPNVSAARYPCRAFLSQEHCLGQCFTFVNREMRGELASRN